MKISVVIPARNRATFIRKCLHSILTQTLPPMEIIVVDDASSDDTADIAAGIDERVKVVRFASSRGAQAARNAGIRLAQGDWIAFNDSDDIWIADKLAYQTHYARQGNSQVIHGAFLVQEKERLSYWPHPVADVQGKVYARLLSSGGPVFQTLLVRKDCLERIGLLDEKVPAYQEWETSIRLARHYSFSYVPTPLFVYHRDHEGTISKDWRRSAEGYAYIVEKHAQDIVRYCGPGTLFGHYRHLAERFGSNGDMERRLHFLRAIEQLIAPKVN